jgi:hypothetical protein
MILKTTYGQSVLPSIKRYERMAKARGIVGRSICGSVVVALILFIPLATFSYHPTLHYSVDRRLGWDFCSLNQDDYLSLSRSISMYGRLVYRQQLTPLFSCILDITPAQARRPHILVPNSICPLGRAFTDLARSIGAIHVVDIRGAGHLNLSEAAVYRILEEINIAKVLFLCPPDGIRLLLRYCKERQIPVYSLFPGIEEASIIKAPSVWGPVRGARSPSVVENWFYECHTSAPLTYPPSPATRYALASTVAAGIHEIMRSRDPDLDLSTSPTFSAGELFQTMTGICRNRTDLLTAARPFPPSSGRNITLSFVTILTDWERVTRRFQLNLQLFDLFIQPFPDLPFEIVVCFGRLNASGPSFEQVVNVPLSLRSKVRIVHLPPGFGREFRSPVFPEFIARNVGVRRSRGEFIISGSSDVVPHASVFDAILHRQFTPFTFFRAPRSSIQLDKPMSLYMFILRQPSAFRNLFAVPSDPGGVTFANSGDFQGGHFSMWALVRGYVESDCTYHVDGMLCADMIWRFPIDLFIKSFVCGFHIAHPQTSAQSHHIRAFISGTKNQKISEGGFHKRAAWGHAGRPELPPAVF